MNNGKKLYFIAIVPPDQIQYEVTEFKNYFLREFDIRQALKSPPHITLHPPFYWLENDEDDIKKGLLNFARKNERFLVTLNGFGAFKPRVIFVDVLMNKSLEILFEKLEYFLEANWRINNQLRKERKFNPHMTIAFRDLTKEQFFQSWPDFKDKHFKREFIASDISLLCHNGKSWNVIDSAPLRTTTGK